MLHIYLTTTEKVQRPTIFLNIFYPAPSSAHSAKTSTWIHFKQQHSDGAFCNSKEWSKVDQWIEMPATIFVKPFLAAHKFGPILPFCRTNARECPFPEAALCWAGVRRWSRDCHAGMKITHPRWQLRVFSAGLVMLAPTSPAPLPGTGRALPFLTRRQAMAPSPLGFLVLDLWLWRNTCTFTVVHPRPCFA